MCGGLISDSWRIHEVRLPPVAHARRYVKENEDHRLRTNRKSAGEHVSTQRITRDAQMWMPDRRRPGDRPRTQSTPSASNRCFHRLMVLTEQNRTALTVAHG
jgi:hypothetical protein